MIIGSLKQDEEYIQYLNNKILEGFFKHNQCENSLYIFNQKDKLRQYLYKITNKHQFDNFILTIIVLSTCRLIFETFFVQNGSSINNLIYIILDVLDSIFNLIFFCECIMKIVSLGFIEDKGSYLRDGWNKLDFIIVLVSLFDTQALITKYT